MGPKTIEEEAAQRAKYEAMPDKDLLVEVALKLDGHLTWHRREERRLEQLQVDQRADRRWLWGAMLGGLGIVIAASSLAVAWGVA